MAIFDVAVIGGGVIGAFVLRNLARYKVDAVMLEKESDVCMGQSKANSGIVHAGFDAKEGTLKAKFNVEGAAMMPAVASELGVKYKNDGSLVVAFSDEDLKTLESLKKRGEKNGVDRLEIISAEELKKAEPNVSDNAKGALYAKGGGIICPYELTIAAIGNAMDNGAKLVRNFEVIKIYKNDEENCYEIYSREGNEIKAKVVVNCAGLQSGKIAALTGDDLPVHGRRGEYILLDKKDCGFVKHTLFFTPTEKGKGILVSPTVDGNILLGPTAEEIPDGDTSTTRDGLDKIIVKANEMCKRVPFGDSITSFAGVRAYSNRHDFVIEESRNCKGVFHLAGIESPGLTSAPAIGKYVVEELISKRIKLRRSYNYNPTREPDYFFKNLSAEEQNELIAKDPSYGRIVCRCERITEGEIIRAIKENPKATTVDSVKRRTRAGMGRCQGGFCQPSVAEIIARETGISIDEITKNGKGSEILSGVTK